MAPLSAGSRAGHAHEFVRMETFTEDSDVSQRGSGNDLRLLQSQSENVGGLRGTISNKLGAALSYSPGASVRDAAAAGTGARWQPGSVCAIKMVVCFRARAKKAGQGHNTHVRARWWWQLGFSLSGAHACVLSVH